MVSITLSVPQEMKTEMNKFPEMNWSQIAREAIKQRLVMLEQFKVFSRESILTEEDSLELGRKINKAAVKKYST